MKLDLKALCHSLGQVEAEETVSTKDCNPYLLEHVLRPLLWDKRLRIRDIDFARFDEEDIDIMAQYSESLGRCSWGLGQFTGAIANLEPAAHRVRRFC